MTDNIKKLEKTLAKRGIKLKLKKAEPMRPLELTKEDLAWINFSQEESYKLWENLLKEQKDD